MDINAFMEKMKNRLEAKYGGKCQIYTDRLDTQLYWFSGDEPEALSVIIFKFVTRIVGNKLGDETKEFEVYNWSFDMEEEKYDIISKNLCFNYYTTPEEKMEAQIFKSMKNVYNLVQNFNLLKKQKWVYQRKKEIEKEFSDDEY